jgi:[glutamine synthetase] adenylyltransferase / [glutamine synthetase]-adenylyl-L-tyrosine phosphorylase
MPKSGFVLEDRGVPEAADPDRARVGCERWQTAVNNVGDEDLAALADDLLGNPTARRALDALFGNSPFLTLVAEQEPSFTGALLIDGPDAAHAAVMEHVAETRRRALAGDNPSAPLRIAKRRLALTTALADITGSWPLETITGALSDFAEAALRCGAGYLLLETASRGAFKLPDSDDPERGSGLIIIGMGKLGARELNYSSDIDLIIFYDPERIDTGEPDALQHHFVRLARNLVRLMADRTSEGYVFRTDLRLRPDPGSTPPAMSMIAAEAYYETLGQNWERAAWIKARPVAGDREAGADVLQQLIPFVWRKNLDFAAIQDIHSIKRQINAHRGSDAIAVAGHNIKLGRGGIREIEFFAQTQQLIWGGRLPELRNNVTVEALAILADTRKIGTDAARALIDAYRFLRRVEHRLQMINDEQTHTLPEKPEKLHALGVFLGYPDANAFREDLLARLQCVEGYYAELFEDAPALSVEDEIGGNLVFTGGEPDPETLLTLERLGFANPEAVDAAIRGWHHGRCRAMRSTRARELLTELMPILLKALSDKPDPHATFLSFDRFLNGLPAGIQLFSMFHAQPQLLELVVEIMGDAPRLAQYLTLRPWVLESVLSADFFEPPPSPEDLLEEMESVMGETGDLEEILDSSRRWANERMFQVGMQSLRGRLDTDQAAVAWSNIAEVALCGLHPRIEREFARQHGTIAASGMAIIAMGKLGGREMSATSDLDLIFVYTTPEMDVASDGPRPLPATQYFARLSQRLINAVTARTTEGRLYEVDMRLRPSGKAGPIAVSIESFTRYQREKAWTWEQMALTRARIIAGPPALAADVEAVIRSVLTRRREPEALAADVADMRARMDEEHHTNSIWEVKHLRGGMVDIEFIAQYLQLRHAHAHPEILSANTMQALRAVGASGILEPSIADVLIEALALWQRVQNRIRLTLSGAIDAMGDEDTPKALRQALCGSDDEAFSALVDRMRDTARRIHALFDEIVDRPAASRVAGPAP